jgi:hypothetical protein
VQDLLHLQVQAPALVMATAAVSRHQSRQLAPACLLVAHQHSLVLPRNCPSLVVSFQPLLDFVVFSLSFCDGFNGYGLSTLVIDIGYRYLWFAFIPHISLPSLPLIADESRLGLLSEPESGSAPVCCMNHPLVVEWVTPKFPTTMYL